MRKTTLTEADMPAIIEEYINGATLCGVARKYHTYPTTVKRLLQKNNIEIRDGTVRKGDVLVTDGDKLLEWAKAQDRLVTKAELAKLIGKTRLSHSYFVKYPELGQYIKPCEQQEISLYAQQLYKWLRTNRISYKPNDRRALEGTPVHAALLGKYKNTLIHIAIKPNTMSRKNFTMSMESKQERARKKGFDLIFLTVRDFPNLKVLHRKLGK